MVYAAPHGPHDDRLIVAAMTVTSLAVWAISHSIITDQMLFFFTSAAMFFAYIGLTEGKKWYVVAAYVMAGFAVLTKGPVGIVLPGTFLLVFIALRRNTQYIKRLFPPAGIVLFLLVVLSWYGTMYARHGAAFIDGFLGFNNVVRATVSEHPEMNVWYYYVVLVPVSLLPWTGPCLYGLWKRRGWTDEYVFMTVWAVGTILFYTAMATKYPTYAYIANMRSCTSAHWPSWISRKRARANSGQSSLARLSSSGSFFWERPCSPSPAPSSWETCSGSSSSFPWPWQSSSSPNGRRPCRQFPSSSPPAPWSYTGF